MKLANATLKGLPARIKRPSYDRTALSAGIVHIGLGNFHRAHQSWYLHRLLEQKLNHDWAILGASVRAEDNAQRAALMDQDYLTTLIELDPSGISAEVVGSMVGYLPIEEGHGPLIAQMADPAIRIVSLTVTEGGYYLDPASGRLDTGHPDIVHDAAHPEHPNTAFGAMLAALRLRRAKGSAPFTGMCCDNLQGNGDILRQTVVGLALLSDPELAAWIDEEMCFPNSMVDCIVPATGKKERALAQDWGVEDAVPVTHENFRQWVIEDKFNAGRPDWDQVGVTFSTDVHAYETMKIRILNGGHQVLANVGEVLHLETICEAMTHPKVQALFRKIQNDEIIPTVNPVPEMGPEAYCALIEKRFSNPAIIDTTRRVAFDGASRHSGFILPVLRENLKTQGASINGLALVEALWARMCEGTREDGSVIEPNDPQWQSLTVCAKNAKETPRLWLEQRSIYGDLANDERFCSAFCYWLDMLWQRGVENALTVYLSDTLGRKERGT